MKVVLIIGILACALFGQVYSYGWHAFPAWGGFKSVVGDVPLYYGIEKDWEMVINSIRFDRGIGSYMVYVEWKAVKGR